MPVKIIEVKDLSVNYGSFSALSDVNFEVDEAAFVGIVGQNGSGKTTLVKTLLGLLPFEGSIKFQGKSHSEFTMNKHIGYLPQKMSYLDKRFPATAREIVVSGVYCCKGFPKKLSKRDYELAEEAMNMLGIVKLKDRPIGRLSGGQQQRVLLARALVHRPAILILDEPTVGLDPKSRDIFYTIIEKLNLESRVTIIMISHDVVSIGKHSTKILYLDQKVIFDGTFEVFQNSPTMSNYFSSGQRAS